MDDLAMDGHNQPEDDGDITLEEEASPKRTARRIVTIENKLERQRSRLARDGNAILAQEERIAEENAKLVQLQAVADATRDDIRNSNEEKEELTQRLARINVVPRDGCEVPPAFVEQDKQVEAVVECLSSALHGLHTFDSQSPQIQSFLRTFTAEIEKLKVAALGTPSPPAAVEGQSLSSSSLSSSVLPQAQPEGGHPGSSAAPGTPPGVAGPLVDGPPVHYDISSEGASADGPTAMAVVGECIGDKRKREHLDDPKVQDASKDTPRALESSDASADTHGHTASRLETAIVVWAPPAASAAYDEYVPLTRAQLREQLLQKIECQAEEAETKRKATAAAAAAAFRASPY